jgi:single-strand DNA-binding protein
MGGLNKVHLIGNLGDDPELKGDKTSVLKCRLATTETYLDSDGNKKENTQWHYVAIFGKRADALAKILKKGMQIFVEGRIENSSYDDKDGVKKYKSEVIATNIVLLGKREDSDRGDDRDRGRSDDRGRDRDRGSDRDRGRGDDRGRSESRGRDDRGGDRDRGRSDDRGRGNDRNRSRDDDRSDDRHEDDIPF